MLVAWNPPKNMAGIAGILSAAIKMIEESPKYRSWGDLKAREIVLDALQEELAKFERKD